MLHHQAALLEHIVHEPRYYADYFRVAFYGDFPDAIRDKEFIVSCCHFPLSRLTHTGLSTVASNGRSLAPSASGCWRSTPEHSSSGRVLSHRTRYDMARHNTSNACQSHQSRIEPWRFSHNRMYRTRCEHTTSIGKIISEMGTKVLMRLQRN